ncbi:hypothetical protein ACSLPB_29580, partial [Escherichia coli]
PTTINAFAHGKKEKTMRLTSNPHCAFAVHCVLHVVAEFLDVADMGITVLDAEQWRKLELMRDSAMAHPAARWMLEAPGYCE